MTACKRELIVPSAAPTAAPEVRCAQRVIDPQTPRAPRSTEWVEWLPPTAPGDQGAARLSDKAVKWVVDVLGVIDVLRRVRTEEHTCLDKLQEKGLISQ